MAIYLCKWPDGDLSIISAKSQLELFDKLDIEGSPMCVEIYELSEGEHIKYSKEEDSWVFEEEGCNGELELNCGECEEEVCKECFGVPFETLPDSAAQEYYDSFDYLQAIEPEEE